MVSYIHSGGEDKKVTDCPLDSGPWILEDVAKIPDNSDSNFQNGDKVDISITCAVGRAKCPDTHPYSYRKGIVNQNSAKQLIS